MGKKKLAHFDLGEKVTPFLQHNVGQSHVVRSLGGSSNMRASMMGLGKDYDKSKNLCFLLNNVMPHFRFQWLSIGIVVINCIRCTNYFFLWFRLVCYVSCTHHLYFRHPHWLALRGHYTPNFKLSCFFVLSQNYQHFFEKYRMHLIVNCPRISKMALKF